MSTTPAASPGSPTQPLSSNELSLPWRPAQKPMSNKQLTHFAHSRGLPTPLFEWTPRFNELPVETMHNILSFADFHVTSKHRKSLCQEIVGAGGKSHLFNAMASVSKGLNEIVEKHCSLLISKHANTEATRRMSLQTPRTQRANWFGYITVRCLFCHKTADTVALEAKALEAKTNDPTAVHDTETQAALNQYCSARALVTSPRLQVITGSPFNHDILCCGVCEVEQWPQPISLRDATVKYGVPPYFFLFPSVSLQVGKRERDYKSGRLVSPRTARGMDLDVDVDDWSRIFFLEHEVEALQQKIMAQPSECVSYWMGEWPKCVEDALVEPV